MKNVGNCKFQKIDVKHKINTKICGKIQFDGVIINDFFDGVFSCITVFQFFIGPFFKQNFGVQPDLIFYFIVKNWITTFVDVSFMIGLCNEHIVFSKISKISGFFPFEWRERQF